MTDQAVDNGGTKVSAEGQRPAAGSAPTESQFLGRTRELKELRADIERAGLDTISGRKAPRARVLLIAGKPGSGRTALAEELAEQVAESYPDGVLRARLTEPDGTPVPTERTARELLTALERPTPPGAGAEDLGESLREALAVRRVLLVLDDAADAEQVDALLPDTPECLVVAVSGGPLTGIADVRPCTLGGLDTKSALELLGRFTGSVRITVDPFAAEGLVELCAGQPAALVLAGGWLATRPQSAVADLAKQLRSDGGGLAAGPCLPAHVRLAAQRRRADTATAVARPGRSRRPAHRVRARGLLGERRPHHTGRLRRARPPAARGVAAAAVRGARLPAAAAARPHREP